MNTKQARRAREKAVLIADARNQFALDIANDVVYTHEQALQIVAMSGIGARHKEFVKRIIGPAMRIVWKHHA